MSSKAARKIPFVIAVAVIGIVGLLQVLPRLLVVSGQPGGYRFDLFQRVEWMTYDWRMRQAFKYPRRVSDNLAAVFIDDETLTHVNEPPDRFHWPWPRQLFGKATRELSAQGARAVAFDVDSETIGALNHVTIVLCTR